MLSTDPPGGVVGGGFFACEVSLCFPCMSCGGGVFWESAFSRVHLCAEKVQDGVTEALGYVGGSMHAEAKSFF